MLSLVAVEQCCGMMEWQILRSTVLMIIVCTQLAVGMRRDKGGRKVHFAVRTYVGTLSMKVGVLS